MPVHLKNFYVRQLTDLKKKEEEEVNKTQKKQPTIPRKFTPPK